MPMIQDIIEVIFIAVSNPVVFIVLLLLAVISLKWNASEPKLLFWGLAILSGLVLSLKSQQVSGAVDATIALPYQRLAKAWTAAKSISLSGINSLDLCLLFSLLARMVKDERTGMYGLLTTLAVICGAAWCITFSGYALPLFG
jgi:hypothetical protein